jgi:hypothetical protein
MLHVTHKVTRNHRKDSGLLCTLFVNNTLCPSIKAPCNDKLTTEDVNTVFGQNCSHKKNKIVRQNLFTCGSFNDGVSSSECRRRETGWSMDNESNRISKAAVVAYFNVQSRLRQNHTKTTETEVRKLNHADTHTHTHTHTAVCIRDVISPGNLCHPQI